MRATCNSSHDTVIHSKQNTDSNDCVLRCFERRARAILGTSPSTDLLQKEPPMRSNTFGKLIAAALLTAVTIHPGGRPAHLTP